jgi:hypothetical protein
MLVFFYQFEPQEISESTKYVSNAAGVGIVDDSKRFDTTPQVIKVLHA